MITLRPWLLLLVTLVGNAAFAQNQLNLGVLAPGQLVVNLSATAEQLVPQDTLNAILEYSSQGKDKVALQDQVNKMMQKALSLLKQETNASIHSQTINYQVFIINAEPGLFNSSNPLWRAQQRLQLDSLDSAKLLELVGELQALGLTVNNLSYSLSNEKYEEVAAALSNDVLMTLQKRAETTAKSLHKDKAELIEVTMNENLNLAINYKTRTYSTNSANALSTENIATPSADPGETQVSVSASARAILSP